MGLGVVVAGLGIGALIAVLIQRTGTPTAPSRQLAAGIRTPAQARPAVPVPLAIATLGAPHTARPAPTPTQPPTVEPTSEPTNEPTPSAAPSPTLAPSPRPTMTPRAVAAASAAPARVAVAQTAPTARAVKTAQPEAAPAATSAPETAVPVPAATAAPAVPAATVAPAATAVSPESPAGSAYDEHASAVVRRYIDALVRGDQKSAYDALGGAGGTLTEQAFIDPTARIVSLKVTRIDAANASVGCEIRSAKGRYYGTYHVTAATSGPYISQHDYIKV